jgi:NADPH:quinone reductase
VNAGARVVANVREGAAVRMRGYGAAETVDHTVMPLADAVRKAKPDGIDVLLDLVSDGDAFSELAALVRSGGMAVTTRYVADTAALQAHDITGINFALQPTSEMLDQLGDALVTGRIVAPPIARISLEEAPAALSGADDRPIEGKIVVTL